MFSSFIARRSVGSGLWRCLPKPFKSLLCLMLCLCSGLPWFSWCFYLALAAVSWRDCHESSLFRYSDLIWFSRFFFFFCFFFFVLFDAPFQWGAGGGGTYSITAVRTYVRPVRNTFGFRAISFELIGVLDWNFIHRYSYIIIKCGPSSI